MAPSSLLVTLGLFLDFFGKHLLLPKSNFSPSFNHAFDHELIIFFFAQGMHINKALYSLSYMCVTAGVAGIVFVGIYLVVGTSVTSSFSFPISFNA